MPSHLIAPAAFAAHHGTAARIGPVHQFLMRNAGLSHGASTALLGALLAVIVIVIVAGCLRADFGGK